MAIPWTSLVSGTAVNTAAKQGPLTYLLNNNPGIVAQFLGKTPASQKIGPDGKPVQSTAARPAGLGPLEDPTPGVSGEALLDMDVRHATGGAVNGTPNPFLGAGGGNNADPFVPEPGGGKYVYQVPQGAEDAILGLPERPGDSAYNTRLRTLKAQVEAARKRRQDDAHQDALEKNRLGGSGGGTAKINTPIVAPTGVADPTGVGAAHGFDPEVKDLKQRAVDKERQQKFDQYPLVYDAQGNEIPMMPGGDGPGHPLQEDAQVWTDANGKKAWYRNDGTLIRSEDGFNRKSAKQTGREVLTTGWESAQGPDDPVDPKEVVQNGQFVWFGNVPYKQGGRTYGRDMYMDQNQALRYPLYAEQQQPGWIANFQRQQGLPVTGVYDKKTADRWKEITDTAVRYSQAGVKMDLPAIAAARAKQNDGGGGGYYRRYGYGGYGGGGGGSTAIPDDTAKALLNRAMLEVAGREATDAEFAAFLPAIKSAATNPDNFDAQQFTLSYVRGLVPQEAGEYQAATNYYQVLLATLGGA